VCQCSTELYMIVFKLSLETEIVRFKISVRRSACRQVPSQPDDERCQVVLHEALKKERTRAKLPFSRHECVLTN